MWGSLELYFYLFLSFLTGIILFVVKRGDTQQNIYDDYMLCFAPVAVHKKLLCTAIIGFMYDLNCIEL